MAPHHPIPNGKFPPITAFLKLAFSPPPFPQEFPTRISRKIFPQEFPARFFCKNFPQDFPATISHNNFPQDFPRDNFPQEFPTRFSRKIFLSWILIGWLPITLFQMVNFHQSLPFLNWLFLLLHFPQLFLATFSHKNFPQHFPTRISHKNFLQDFPELDPDWLSAHHPIPNGKFPPITAFLKLAFSPPPFSARISHKNFPQQFPATISHKNFLQDFPTRFSRKIFLSWILIGWLPITLFQVLNFHQSLPS